MFGADGEIKADTCHRITSLEPLPTPRGPANTHSPTSVFSFSQNYSHIIIPILARDPAINDHRQPPSNPILHPPSQSLVINKTTLKYLVTPILNLICIIGTAQTYSIWIWLYSRSLLSLLTMDRVKIFMDASVNLNVSCSLRGRQPGREAPPSLADADLQLSS